MQTPPGKKKAVIAYITFVGMFIAYFMNRDEPHEFARAHIKNMFGLVLLQIIHSALLEYINDAIGFGLWILLVLIWSYSIIACILNKWPAIPFLSKKFQQWFTFLN